MCQQAGTSLFKVAIVKVLSIICMSVKRIGGEDAWCGSTNWLHEYQLLEVEDHPLFADSYLLGDKENIKRYAKKRHLNPCTFEDLYFMHQISHGSKAVSRKTLERVWEERWQKYMPIRNVGQGKRCKKCAECSEGRKSALTAEDQLYWREIMKQHIEEIRADRNYSARFSPHTKQIWILGCCH